MSSENCLNCNRYVSVSKLYRKNTFEKSNITSQRSLTSFDRLDKIYKTFKKYTLPFVIYNSKDVKIYSHICSMDKCDETYKQSPYIKFSPYLHFTYLTQITFLIQPAHLSAVTSITIRLR